MNERVWRNIERLIMIVSICTAVVVILWNIRVTGQLADSIEKFNTFYEKQLELNGRFVQYMIDEE